MHCFFSFVLILKSERIALKLVHTKQNNAFLCCYLLFEIFSLFTAVCKRCRSVYTNWGERLSVTRAVNIHCLSLVHGSGRVDCNTLQVEYTLSEVFPIVTQNNSMGLTCKNDSQDKPSRPTSSILSGLNFFLKTSFDLIF